MGTRNHKPEGSCINPTMHQSCMADLCFYAGGTAKMNMWQNNHCKTHPSRMQKSTLNRDTLRQEN